MDRIKFVKQVIKDLRNQKIKVDDDFVRETLKHVTTKQLLEFLNETYKFGGRTTIIGDNDTTYAVWASNKQIKDELNTREHIYNKIENHRLRYLMSKFKMKKDEILSHLKFRNFIFKGDKL